MRGCAECMPDFAKCRTAEQVPRAEERAFSFPASHSLALGVSRQRPGGGGQKSERSAGVRCHCVLSRDGPGGERAGGGGQRESPALGCVHTAQSGRKTRIWSFCSILPPKGLKGKPNSWGLLNTAGFSLLLLCQPANI